MKKKHWLAILILLVLIVIVTCLWIRSSSSGTSSSEIRGGDQASQAAETPQGEGSLVVKGTGEDLYEVHDATGEKKLNFARTNEEMKLPAGTYVVSLHSVPHKIEVTTGGRTVIQAGALVVSGTGNDLYEVYDSEGKRKLSFTKTNSVTELLPGTYVLSLQRVQRKLEIQPGKKTVIESGALAVEGNTEGLYYVYDETGKNRLDFRGTNRAIELLPGKYVVTINGREFPVEVKPNQETIVNP